MPEADFRIAWLMKALLHQFADPFLSSRPFRANNIKRGVIGRQYSGERFTSRICLVSACMGCVSSLS
jgi:hypothetical protein